MKQKYIQPQISIVEFQLVSMLAASTDRIPVGGSGTKPSAAKDRYYMEEEAEETFTWGDIW